MKAGSSRGVTVVKLGGSVVTDKSVPFSYRGQVVARLGEVMAGSGIPLVVVHGGGSFGHTVAKKFGLSSRKTSKSPSGVSETRAAMYDLNSKVCDSLISAGLHPYPLSPFSLLDTEEGGQAFVSRLLAGGMTPVTFGDVVHDGEGFRILSGDTICVEMAEMLGAKLCVMTMGVDGLLDGKGRVIKVFGEGALPRLAAGGDATGGIAFKVKEALRMASSGTEVRFVSGQKPAEFSKCLKGLEFLGTTVRVPDGVSIG